MSAFDDALGADLAARQDRAAQHADQWALHEAERRELFQQYIAPIYLDARDALLRRDIPLHRAFEPRPGLNPKAVLGWPLGKFFLDENGGMRGIRVGRDVTHFIAGKTVVFSVTEPADVYKERVHIVDGNAWRLDDSYSDAITDRPVEWEVRQLLMQGISLMEKGAQAAAGREQK